MDARPAQGHEMPATESFPEWRERADPKRPLRELRRCEKITCSISPRENGIIPLPMELVFLDFYGSQLLIRHRDSLGIAVGVQCRPNAQPRPRPGMTDQLHDCCSTHM